MSKKFFLIFLNLIFLLGCIGCNPISETAINLDIKPPQTGWQIFLGEKIAISLPENIEGGNPNRELQILTEKLKNLDCVTPKTTEKLDQNSKSISFIGFLPKCEASHLAVGINIISQKVSSEITLDQYLEKEVNKLKNKAQIIEQDIIKNNQLSVGRIISEIELDNLTMKQLFYVIPEDQNYWIITYTSTADLFEQNLPMFEASFKTFQVLSN